MIASFSHNFIFIKSRKTGGTSAEIVMSAWCSGADICTEIYAPDEIIRAKYGGRRMNDLWPDGHRRFKNHDSAKKVKTELPELWRRAYKFTIERDPFEKVISRAWWNIARRSGDPCIELAPEIDNVIEKKSYLNMHIYSFNGRIAVDEVISYCHLWERLGEIATRLGASLPPDLPRSKGFYRKDRRPAHEVLSAAQKRQITHDAHAEFEILARAVRPAADTPDRVSI